MSKVILLVIILAFIGIPSAFANVSISSDSYEMGDFLKVQGYSNDYVTIDVKGNIADPYGNVFQKSYIAKFDGLYEVGLPLSEELGYTSGIYDVTISYGDTVKTEQFGLDVHVPTFTLYAERSIVHLNEYAFFFGTVKGIDVKDYSFSGNVLIQILDSDGNLLEDNFFNPHITSKSTELATKSLSREPIKNHDELYLIPDQDRIHGDNFILDHGYRKVIKIDPTIYEVGHTYTIKVTHDIFEKSVNFLVLDYLLPQYSPIDDVCSGEQKNFDYVKRLYEEYLEAGNTVMSDKYEIKINNFKVSSGCN